MMFMMTSVRGSTLSCLQAFADLREALATAEQEYRKLMPPEKIESAQGRFNIWCGNLGALQSGRSSLDFRLRDSAVMEMTVMKLLNKLQQTLTKSIEVASGARLPLEKLPTPAYSSDEESEDESENDSEGEYPNQLMATELGQHILTIAEILAELFKLSFKIRNTAGRMKLLKPTLYKEVDEETDVDKFVAYNTYDRGHVVESLEQLRKAVLGQTYKITTKALKEEEWLVKRLADTITKRRRLLRYWERHAKKLRDASSSAKEVFEVNRDLQERLLTPKGITLNAEAGPLTQQPKLVASVRSPSVMDQTILSGTEASRYVLTLDDSLETQSFISYASETSGIDGIDVALPLPPAEALTGSEFHCPHCGIVCPSRLAKGRAWRSHILQDLQPYICTYSSCLDELQMYSDKRSWLEHERLLHRRVWQCFEHSDAVFPSRAELNDHLKLEHIEYITEAQIENLLDVSESSVADNRQRCSICLLEAPFPKGLDSHLSFHLETFATFSISRGIPGRDESETEPEGNSQGAQGAGSNDWAESVSLDFKSAPVSLSSSESGGNEGHEQMKNSVNIGGRLPGSEIISESPPAPQPQPSVASIDDDQPAPHLKIKDISHSQPSHRIVVGIDLGLISTGVAFATTDQGYPQVIQRWPDSDGIHDRVPTVVWYRAGNRDIKAWGFSRPGASATSGMNGMSEKKLFKLFLDERFWSAKGQGNTEITVSSYYDVQDCYRDFLSALYQYASKYIKDTLRIASWKNCKVDFLFGYPATWSKPTIAQYQAVATAAGFGAGGKEHKVEMLLSEPEAIVVYIADSLRYRNSPNPLTNDLWSKDEDYSQTRNIKVGDEIIVCDSGSDTTDICVVRPSSLTYVNQDDEKGIERFAELELYSEPKCAAIGSLQIDQAFENILEERLETISRADPNLKIPKNTAHLITKHQFQTVKYMLGGIAERSRYGFEIAGLSGVTLSECMIENGKIIFTREDIQELFDAEISGIFDLIDEELSTHSITHLALSGDLGSLVYVQQRLRERYQNIKIIIGEQPQLAVCRGLVIDRLLRLGRDGFILPSRFINTSYGVVLSEPPIQSRKQKARVLTDGEDCVGQIHWLVDHRTALSKTRPIRSIFYRIVDIGCVGEVVWKDKIVTSRAPTALRLPQRIHDGDTAEVCELESKIRVSELEAFERKGSIKRKQKKVLGIKVGKEFWKIEIEIVVSVVSSGLKFETYLGGGIIGSCCVPVSSILEHRGYEEEDGDDSS